jgi:D-alanyl-D-alanine carboxypeptidase/D-alanyl-D-alanine-endopeptidase (penicillin-binding protein 4)
MRLYALTFCLCAPAAIAQTVAPFPTGAATPLGQQLTAITTEPAVSRAHWGIAVTTLDGTPIYGLNEGQLFRPASNAKLFTTAAAMHLIGPSSRIETSVETFSDPDANGILKGDITLVGNGDANLSGRSFPYRTSSEIKSHSKESAPAPYNQSPLHDLDQFAAEVAKAGVRHITGDVIADDVWDWNPYPDGWEIDDTTWGYGAPVAGLSINDNQLQLIVVPATKPGLPPIVKLLPDTGYYTVQVTASTVAAKAPAVLGVDRAPGSLVVRVAGTVAIGQPYSTEIAIDDPPQFAAAAFKQALISHGIAVDGTARVDRHLDESTENFATAVRQPLIFTLPKEPQDMRGGPSVPMGTYTGVHLSHMSPTLADDIKLTLKISQNLHAEMMLRRIGDVYGTFGSATGAAGVVRQFLLNAGLDGDDFILYDGSGLSSHDLVTPRATAKLLAYATQQPWFAQWKSGLPVGGEDGTLSGRFAQPPLKDHIFAKTGTLGESRALSGYLDCASGKTVIFSIMVDNHTPTTHADRDALDNIIAAIAADN